MGEKPTDDQIIASMNRFGGSGVTYAIANGLRMFEPCFNIRTDWLLRQLKRMERQGRVERAPTSYSVQICWKVARHD